MHSILKIKNGQAGADGNQYLRTKRIEIRVCQQELNLIEKQAIANGYNNIAQYLRASGLMAKAIESPKVRQRDKTKWLYEVNRIGNNLNQVARHLNQGRPIDDEIMLYLAQIAEMAHETMKSSLKDTGEI